MHPFLFDITVFGLHIRPPSYGVFLALAFSTAYFVSLYRAAKIGEDPKHIENLFLLVVLGSVVGARLFHVLFEEPGYYAAHPEKIIAVWEGGYTLYGAMLAAILAMFLYCRGKKIDYLNFMDIAAAATAIGISIGRFGCFLAGCCWGKPTQCILGVTFSHPLTFAGIKTTPVHPTQLYESFGALLLFFYFHWRFNRRQYKGQIFFHGLLLYPVLRFLIEYFRGDEYRGYILHGLLSYSQLVSLAMIPFGIAGVLIYRTRPLEASPEKASAKRAKRA